MSVRFIVCSIGKRLNHIKNMISEAITMKMLKYSDEILEVIDHNDEFTQGDLQARIEAIVLTILNEEQK